MNDHCNNCGQPALAGDSACWQCGEPLASVAGNGRPAATREVSSGKPATDQAGIIYGTMAVVVILLTLIVTFSLGQMPLVQLTLRDRLPPDWHPVTAVDNTFTVDLPKAWLWYEKGAGQQETEFDRLLAENGLFLTAVQPWNEIDPSLEIVFLAHSPPQASRTSPTILVVARSARLGQLSEERAIAVAAATGYPFLESDIVADYDRSHAAFVAPVEVNGILFRCRQQLVPGRQEGLLVSACVRQEWSGLDRNLLTRMLSSFQHLSP